MIKLDQRYARQDFIDFLQDTFFQDYVRDVRPVDTRGLNAINKATSLGRSDSLDLQVFEFEYSGSANRRVALTKEAFQIMKQSATFHALAVFYGQDSDDWRLSFMTANPEKTEKGRVILGYSNPRRFSFFLGPNAKINTPNRFLIKNGQIKNFDDLLSRFNVEIVTKEFFENYKKLFDRLLAYLNKDHVFQSFAGRNGVETANFAKKLLGQIVFLYFLQRKGWLGAKRGDSISMGDKDFLRSLFSKSADKKVNFYNTYLEPLFYGALNKPPEKAGSYYRSYFDCQIPFLNGGLFEPPQDYDWEGEFLLLPDKLFSKNPKDPSHGDGILDIFDLYNFTVDESDFLDKEVSVDPEMLGKVFENLLEENLRKGKGTYYTPREIVNYMCEESVVNYLATESGLISEDVKNKYFPAYNVLGDEKFEARDVSVSEQIIESLKNIKVVDPACGSGAFLVGMLQQITHLRYDLEERSKLLGRRDSASSEYEIKKQTIQNCIYGVDIDPGAVDIAKLRLWLSLVVDYDLEEIEPLPNLDYKIMQGNSLLEELVLGDTTVKLYDQRTIQKAVNSKRMKNLFEADPQMAMFDDVKKEQALKNMKALQVQYFSQSDAGEKKKIRTQIEKIEHDLIEVSVKAETEKLSAQRLNIRTIPGIGLLPEDAKRLMNISSKESQIMAVLDELKKTGTKPFFLWHLHFADVFSEKQGFDIVIANPPYGFRNVLSSEEKRFFRKTMKIKFPSGDIAELFIIISLSKFVGQNGVLTFIIPKKSLYGESWSNVRKIWLENNLYFLMDASQAFESVLLEQSAFSVQKRGGGDRKITVGALDQDVSSVRIFGDFPVADIFTPDLRNAQIYRALYPASLLKKITENSIPNTSSVVKAEMGISNTTEHLTFEADGNYPCVKGIDIIRYGLKPTVRYLKGKIAKQYSGEYQDSKIVSQKIIAHIQNPRPHILITMFYDDEHRLINDTCVEIKVLNEKLNKKFLLGYLQSEFSNWYAYNFVYNRAIRTMDFINYYVTQIPIPIRVLDEPEKQTPIIKLVDQILSITKTPDYRDNPEKQARVKDYEKQIDQMVYELYGLTLEEIEIVERNSKK